MAFVNFADLVTFTRASSATRTNAAGVIESVSSNVARMDYDPISLEPRGFLREEQRTNLLLNSLLNGTSLSTQNVSVTGVYYTLSFYGTGSVTLSGAHSAVVAGSGAYPARSIYTFVPSVGTLTLTVSGTVQYAQLEAAFYATSFIPTAGSQVTRASDEPYVSNAGGWLDTVNGTLLVEFSVLGIDTGHGAMVAALDNGSADGYSIYRNSSSAVVEVYGGAANSAALGSVTVGSVMRAVVAYQPGQVAGVMNGGTMRTAVPASVSALDRLRIGTGSNGLNRLSGHIRSMRYFPKRLPDYLLKALTS